MNRVTEKEYRLMKLDFIKSLPYEQKVTAIGMIGKGADASLLYFWFNLMERNYFPAFSIMQVRADAERMAKEFPDFSHLIEQWFGEYKNYVTKQYGNNRN